MDSLSQNMELRGRANQRNRLDSIPIVNGIEVENPIERETDPVEVQRKRKRTESDENDIRKMEIFKRLSNDEDDILVIETRVISGIIENMEDGNVKALIEWFNPIIRHSPDIIKQQMIHGSMEWENKKEIYIGAINYIKHGRQDIGDDEKQLNDLEVDSLCMILVKEIENRMPKHCKQCDDWYIVQLSDKPDMHCMWCKVGKHDCIKVNNDLKCSGFKWLCDKCEPVFNKHLLPKMDQAATFEGFVTKSAEDENKKMKTASDTNMEMDGDEKDNDEKEPEEPQEEEISVVTSNEEGKTTKNEIMNNPNSKENKETNKNGDNRNINQNLEGNDKKTTCWYWKNRKCRFGSNCKDDHPEQCKDILETGLCKESRCKLAHPKICRNLFYKGYCPRGNACWFIHPSKIRNNQININNNNLGNRSSVNNMNMNGYDNRNNENAFRHNGENRNATSNFLGTWPPLRNDNMNYNQNPGMNQMQPMMQMMETMMERISRVDNKLIHLEMRRGMYN